MTHAPGETAGLQSWARRQGEAYRNGHERPLGGYLSLIGVYTAGTVAGAALARLRGRRPPNGLSVWDCAQLTVATHKLARLIAKDPVTSPLRAPAVHAI
jgi:Protein of unknown function (DUF1360)